MAGQGSQKIGIIGFGQIGSSLYRMIMDQPELGLETAFIYDSDPDTAARIPAGLNLPSRRSWNRSGPLPDRPLSKDGK